MSGHSKWATIHRQKEAKDAKKGQQFTKISNAIIVAVKEGGGVTDPEGNFKLRLAIDKARAINMPKDNIQRAIERGKGLGAGGEALEEVLYEGYGPSGVGVLVEAVTDNKQRTAQVIKNLFDRSGGSLAGPGSVSFQFQRVGLIVVEKQPPVDEQVLKLIDLGAQDVEEVEDGLEVYIAPARLEQTKRDIADAGFQVRSAELAQKAASLVTITDPAEARRVISFLDSLESLDDIQKVWANADIPQEVLA